MVAAAVVVRVLIAQGQTDNCLPCSNCGVLAQLESAHCVGVRVAWVNHRRSQMRGRLSSFCQWESHMKARSGTLLWEHHFWV